MIWRQEQVMYSWIRMSLTYQAPFMPYFGSGQPLSPPFISTDNAVRGGIVPESVLE